MATTKTKQRIQVGSAPWIAEERSSADAIINAESEEFGFSVRNDLEWLNEHMAEIFSENQINVAEVFKTPGKLRGKTPRTARKANPLEARVPLSDVFSATPRGAASPFKQLHFEQPNSTFRVAEDEPTQTDASVHESRAVSNAVKPVPTNVNFLDSGYYGSQATQNTQHTYASQATDPFYEATQLNSPIPTTSGRKSPARDVAINTQEEQERRSTEGSYQSAEEGNVELALEQSALQSSPSRVQDLSHPVLRSPLMQRTQMPASPQKWSPNRPAQTIAALVSPRVEEDSPDALVEDIPIIEEPSLPSNTGKDSITTSPSHPAQAGPIHYPTLEQENQADALDSPHSDGSSPIRPIVRKSSLNFASLPAREPLTSKKSIGNRVSRTSHVEASRTSYYGRNAANKSNGHAQDEMDDMYVDGENDVDVERDEAAKLHNKTSTRRLQDQISMLGKSQPSRVNAKSISACQAPSTQVAQIQPVIPQIPPERSKSPQRAKSPERAKSPVRKSKPPPGAFPDDEEDSWIGPSNAATSTLMATTILSPRPPITKSYTTDVMEDIHEKLAAAKDLSLSKQMTAPTRPSPGRETSYLGSPQVPYGHVKSVSTSVLRSPGKVGEIIDGRPISVSNPTPGPIDEPTSPLKSPSKSYRGSPLKAAKDKFSSILKTSRGLFASSAAISADAKSNLSSSPSRLNLLKAQPSMASLVEQPLYPNLALTKTQSNASQNSESPGRGIRKTRASTEREEKRKLDEAREAKEQKEAKKMDDQLQKARQKVTDEARLFKFEQDKVLALQKQVAAKQEEGRLLKQSQADLGRITRSSPKKTKAQLEAEGVAAAALPAEDLESKQTQVAPVVSSMAPPILPVSKSQIGRLPVKRPIKPAKEPLGKTRPPTVIRVDTGSQRGHQYQSSTSSLASNLQDILPDAQSSTQSKSTQGSLRHKASTSSIQSKSSNGSFKSGATKALEAAARKKEQDELAVQKKREAKLEVERQRAAIKEEEKRKEEQQRRQEAERQREMQRERERAAAAADAKKATARQTTDKRKLELEKAKENRPPPPAIRPQPSAESLRDKALPPLPQAKAQRFNSTAPHSQDESSRSIPQHIAKIPPKRTLQETDEQVQRPGIQRNAPSYQQNEAQTKRRKTNEIADDSDENATNNLPKMSAPPLRQSSVRQPPIKSIFGNGYSNVPPTAANLQRSTLISQHNTTQTKAAHPLDMTTVSKAPIAFAGPSQPGPSSYKTPARPPNANGKSAMKSAKSAKSSPRFQDGEHIILDEINTDSEDDEEDKPSMVPAWANSPALREALTLQEGIDPTGIFGGPKELDMEAVFNKSKERFHKFRARTSSANWSGEDRLTQDEINKDVEARNKLRRQGFWSYDHMV